METIDTFVYVLMGTIVMCCLFFIIFCIQHGRENKKELHKTKDNKDSNRQLDKSGNDVK